MTDDEIASAKKRYLSVLPATFYPILAAEKAGCDIDSVEKWRIDDLEFDTAIKKIQRQTFEVLNHRLLVAGMGQAEGSVQALLKAISSVEIYLTKTNNAAKIATENKTLETICEMLHCTRETILQTIQRLLMNNVKPAKRKPLKDYDETNQIKPTKQKGA